MSEEQPHEFVPPELEELNQLIPAYEFVSFIAKGGMGAVYLARQNSLDRLVAIKVLPPILCQNVDFKSSFETEAKLMAKLNHSNLIGIYDFGEINGMLYIVMEYVKGKSLFDSSYGKMIEQETAVNIITGVCHGLEHAHDAGLLHRDVKPANILLTNKAVPKIGDFGLARPSEMTETGVIFGTPDYSAPEVLGAPEKVDKRTDIFAVGIILYELMTGQLPKNPYVSVAQFADTDPRFDAIILKAMHPQIEQRYATTMDLVDALDNVLKTPKPTNRLLATGSNAGVRTAVAPVASTTVSASGPTLLKAGSSQAGSIPLPQLNAKVAKPSSGKPALICIGLLVVTLAGIFFFVSNSRSKEAQKVAAEKERQEEVDRLEAEALKEREKARLELEAETARKREERKKAAEEALIVVSPLEELEKIKSKLADGERPLEEMPETIFKRSKGSRILMFVETPMTWKEALAWTEAHGGYIAAENNGWAWIDGTPWPETIALPPSKMSEVLTLSKEGKMGVSLDEERLPFFIEWRADGTNPVVTK